MKVCECCGNAVKEDDCEMRIGMSIGKLASGSRVRACSDCGSHLETLINETIESWKGSKAISAEPKSTEVIGQASDI